MSFRIVFMGTPDFAVPCLERLIQDGHEIVGVFSQPDRPKGRGNHLEPTPVKKAALQHDVPVFQPTKLKDGTALALLQELAPDLIVVVAYGRILPKEILEVPPLGCINVHASLLPRWRGSAPIQWSIISGDEQTGVSTMYMAEELDAGDIIFQSATPIGTEETAGALFERLSQMGAELISKTVVALGEKSAPRIPQNTYQVTYAPMLEKQMGLLDFNQESKKTCQLIRGVSPWPGAYCFLNGERLVVKQGVTREDYSGTPGEILNAKELIVGTKDGAVQFLTVQPAGKKEMTGSAYSAGRRLQGGEIFTQG